MGKAHRKTDEGRFRDKRGLGEFENYIPWHTVVGVGSRGCSYRPRGIKVQRSYVFLSKIEYEYFLLAEWNDDVIDIREQFPLDLGITKAISRDLGVKHPKERGLDTVMTTDFVLTIKGDGKPKTIVRAIKPEDELSTQRTVEKLSIERRYWKKQGVEWKVITDNDIPKYLVKNIEILRPNYQYYMDCGMNRDVRRNIMKRWMTFLPGESINIMTLSNSMDVELDLQPGTVLKHVKAMIYEKQLKVNLLSGRLNCKAIRKEA